MNRRFFLAGSAGVAALAAPLRARVGSTHGLCDAAEIGRAVLRAGAIEPDERVLRRELGLGPVEPFALDRSWRDAIRGDFAAGDTVHIEGWVLSRTEARLCALAALSLVVA